MKRKTKNSKLLLAVTSPISWKFYKGLASHLRESGLEVTLLSSPGANLTATAESEGVASAAVPLEREIAPRKDLISLVKLYFAIRRMRPDLVDASTPKAGFLVSVAARLAGARSLVYTLRGLRLETTTGIKRWILWMTEWIACSCADQVVCVSSSLEERVIALGLAPRKKTIVLGKGSSGVDVQHFTPKKARGTNAKSLALELGIPGSVPVIGFVGRIVKDKGIGQLVMSFDVLRSRHPELRLLLVGDFENSDPLDPEVRSAIESNPAIIQVGFVSDPSPYYGLMDVLAVPTYREGFCQVSLEAQASGVPVVTTRATGAIDSIIDGVTGLLVPVGDATALAEAIGRLLDDSDLRRQMARAGREWVERDFRPEILWEKQTQLYDTLLANKESKRARRKLIVKRTFDFCIAVLALFVLFPVFSVVAIFVALLLGRPVLFRQVRPGLNGQAFTIFKFRTMTDARGANGELLPDAQRLTAFGRFLRSTSLDELPELFNVIRGEMSLVGPRPLLPQYLERYTPEQMRRHAVKPGITGWAQINGRNSLYWDSRFNLDCWYVDNHSMYLDIRILARTVWQVIRRDGIAQEGHATMPEFLGVPASHEKGNA